MASILNRDAAFGVAGAGARHRAKLAPHEGRDTAPVTPSCAQCAVTPTWATPPTWRTGVWGHPMSNRNASAPRVRGTRTLMLAAALSACLRTASRKGRGVQLSGFACEVFAPYSLASRPEKRLFLGANALFFIARNEGSSMTSDNYSCIHRIKYTLPRGKHKNDRDTRAMLSFRFRAMYRSLGLSRPDAAQLLHVSERTLHNWETGHHEIPYSAYRLLRLLTRQELPGKAWTGWHITAGVLWSPEGHGFKPEDSSWWSMLCRRSAQFHSLYAENSRLKRKNADGASDGQRSGVGAVDVGGSTLMPLDFGLPKGRNPVTPSFFPVHRNFRGFEPVQSCPASVRFARVLLTPKLFVGGVK
jgi:DNA-binding transcriptional regulator YiaG